MTNRTNNKSDTDRIARLQAETPTDRVAVVADQTDDGAYEIRVERQGRAPTQEATVTSLSSSGSQRQPVKRALPTVLLVSVALAILVAVAIGVTAGQRESPEPEVVEPTPIETFRAFTVAAPVSHTVPTSPVFDAGTDADEAAYVVEPEPAPVAVPVVTPVFDPSGIEHEVAPQRVAFDPAMADRLRNVHVSPTVLTNRPAFDDELLEDDEFDDEDLDDDELDEEDLEDDELAEDDFADDEYEDDFIE